jgi:hypothetical protein
MLVRVNQLRSFRIPLGAEVAFADQTFGFDLENVSKISPQQQFQLEADGSRAVIANVKILVNAVAYSAVHDEGTGVLQNPVFAISEHVITAYVACVARVDPLIGTGTDRGVRLCHNKSIAPVDGVEWKYWRDGVLECCASEFITPLLHNLHVIFRLDLRG